MTEQTDAAIDTLILEHGVMGQAWPTQRQLHAFARAVLAKWGTPPAVAGEPVAWLSTDSIGERYLCFTKPNDSDPVRPLVFGDTTPQPTQAQAGAGLMVDRATVIEWLDANDIEVTDRQMEGLFHFAAPTPPAQAADSVLEDAALSQAARDVLAERQRQINAEGWTPEHDDEHGDRALCMAAVCYVLGRTTLRALEWSPDIMLWPWEKESWKPKDPRQNLIKAGALILAELERIDRAARKQGVNHDK